MRNQVEETRNGSSRKLLLATAGMAVQAVLVVAGVLTMPRLGAQSTAGQAQVAQPPIPQWQIVAGGKMSFDVASVKVNKSGDRPHSNIPLNAGDTFSPTGGLLSTTSNGLLTYIMFAYKLSGQSVLFRLFGLPAWASIQSAEKFDIEAHATGNPTKDQMRLMMQSLLEDRFKFAMHHETRSVHVFALGLSKPGITGPQLQVHANDQPCSNTPTPGYGLPPTSAPTVPSAPSVASGLQLEPIPCGVVIVLRPSAGGLIRIGARNVRIQDIAESLGGDSTIDRPVIDQTGLGGTFDFSLEWKQQLPSSGSQTDDSHQDSEGPSLVEALQKQLGLRLVPQTASVDVLVIDHVEEPSPN